MYIERYLGYEIEIFYLLDNSGIRDRGRLVDMGDGWIVLSKTGGDIFLVPTSAIRLVKPLRGPDGEGNLLLRAVSDAAAKEPDP